MTYAVNDMLIFVMRFIAAGCTANSIRDIKSPSDKSTVQEHMKTEIQIAFYTSSCAFV
jgi:hypothetical protein